jgi:hypothetical protein
MCGSNNQQQQITDQQQQFYQQLTQQYATVFGQNQAITGALTSAFQPILAAGPSQTGFSPSEETALETQNTENTATNYAQAQKATAQILAARGGGNTLLPSSVSSNILAQNTNAAAQQRAQGQNTITQANYAQGYQNWQTAAGVLGSTAGLLNPTSYSGQATGAGSAASTSAYQMAEAANSPWNAAFGALGSIGGAFAGNAGLFGGGGAGGVGNKLPPCWIAAELYGGWYEPRTVLIRHWLVNDFSRLSLGRKLVDIYRKYGQRTAAAIRRYPVLRIFFRPLFDLALRQAVRSSYAR